MQDPARALQGPRQPPQIVFQLLQPAVERQGFGLQYHATHLVLTARADVMIVGIQEVATAVDLDSDRGYVAGCTQQAVALTFHLDAPRERALEARGVRFIETFAVAELAAALRMPVRERPL